MSEPDMDTSSRDRLRPIAQTLPADVLCELYFTAARSDPPVRKHAIRPYIPPIQKNAAKEPLGPTWSQIPAVGTRRNDYIRPTSAHTAHEGSLGWILLTHVCSQWRSVGLSLSSLWGDVFSMFPKVASTLLSRARDAPLTFDMEFLSSLQPNPFQPCDYLSSFENLARQHLSSAGTMTFAPLGEPSWSWTIKLLYHHEFPLLKDLRAQVSYIPFMHPDYETSVPLAPSLKRLVLNVFIPFTAPNLTNLELTRLDASKGDEVLTLLRSSPLLEELLLQWNRASRSSPFVNHFGNVHLPRLTTALFTGIPGALAFTRNLDIPSHADLGFTTYSLLDLPSLLDTIGPRMSDSGANCFSFSSSCDADVFAASIYQPEKETSPRIFITVSQPELSLENRLAFFHEILIRTNPDRIVSLHVDPCTYMSMSPLEDMVNTVLNGLRALSALISLSVACVPIAREWPFLEALRGSSNPDLHTFAPALETLTIFSDDTLLDKDFTKTEAECVQHRWDRIIFVLEHRQKIGLPLRRLELEGARGDDPEIASINASGFARAAVFVDEVIDNRKDHALIVVES
ncbi:hypothetical protein PENSPDRAFT_750194 [Peniophora sp. CONT]|nr:hypothetical protein PENSPDRAFT_750194 [Peniophora sp. CONT]